MRVSTARASACIAYCVSSGLNPRATTKQRTPRDRRVRVYKIYENGFRLEVHRDNESCVRVYVYVHVCVCVYEYTTKPTRRPRRPPGALDSGIQLHPQPGARSFRFFRRYFFVFHFLIRITLPRDRAWILLLLLLVLVLLYRRVRAALLSPDRIIYLRHHHAPRDLSIVAFLYRRQPYCPSFPPPCTRRRLRCRCHHA